MPNKTFMSFQIYVKNSRYFTALPLANVLSALSRAGF